MNAFLSQMPTMRQEKIADKKWFLSKTFKLSLSVLVIVFGVLYVVQTSLASTKGFAINDLRSKIQNLERENQKLDLQIANYRSMKNIQSQVKEMNLVAVTDVQYITPVGTEVALK